MRVRSTTKGGLDVSTREKKIWPEKRRGPVTTPKKKKVRQGIRETRKKKQMEGESHEELKGGLKLEFGYQSKYPGNKGGAKPIR